MKNYSIHNVNKVFLMLGPACNFKCRYCLQTGVCAPPKEPTEEVYQYLERLVKIRPSYQNPLAITFWGGEPLVYIDVIRKVIARLGNKLSYGLVTNGALLTPELVDYFNLNDVTVTLSNDGAETAKTRNVNMLDDDAFCEIFCRLNKRHVESVTSPYNYDYAKLFDYIEEKLPGTTVTVDLLNITWDMPADIYDIPLEEYEHKLRYLAGQALADMINLKDTSAAKLFAPPVNTVINPPNDRELRCGNFFHHMNIDCDGNVYACHNCGDKIGHINEERIIMAERMRKYIKQHTSDDCKDCPVYPICFGGCPLETWPGKEISCEINRVFYGVCMDLANAYLNSFESVDWEV